MSIRPAIAADIHRLIDLNIEVQDLHVAHMPDLFTPMRREEVAPYWEEMLASGAARVLVADEGDEVVGYMLLILRERPENPGISAQRWLYVEQIGVTAAHRGKGHASALIQAARDIARENGLERIELDTWGFNERAQAFFRSQGFHVRNLRMGMPV